MLSRENALKVIEDAYAARVAGDKVSLANYWADGAHFEIVGDRSLLKNVPLTAAQPMQAISVLIDQFQFHDLKLLNSVVEGNNVAAHWQVTISVAGKEWPTQLFDLIKLDDNGKITSFVQFADTALVREMAKFIVAPAPNSGSPQAGA